MERLRFSKIVVDFTLDEALKCNACPTVLEPFSVVFVRHNIEGKACDFICEPCLKKEVKQRTDALRDQYAMKKVR